MATNEILPFSGTDTGTNLLTQAEYSADAQRPIGNQAGIARSKLVNKVLKQTSLMAAGLAEFLADNQAVNVTDALTAQNIADMLKGVVQSFGLPTAVTAGTGDAITANFSPDIVLSDGLTVVVRATAVNTVIAPTFNPDGLGAKAIVKRNNQALVAGDIAGAGHWLFLTYDLTNDKWVLSNPNATSAVLITGNQTIAGVKTFSSSPVIPVGANANEAVNKSQLDAIASLGVGQTWQDMTASRALGTTYTNSTGKPIQLAVSTSTSSSGSVGNFIVNGSIVNQPIGGALNASTNPCYGIVPIGATYSITIASGTAALSKWSELR